jgi:hypothetical protein
VGADVSGAAGDEDCWGVIWFHGLTSVPAMSAWFLCSRYWCMVTRKRFKDYHCSITFHLF